MWHPPYGDGGVTIGTNMGFIDGHVETIINTRSNVPGEYWLQDVYDSQFVVPE